MTTEIPELLVEAGTSDKLKLYLSAELNAPFVANAFATGCDTSCSDPDKSLRIGNTLYNMMENE